MTSFFAKGFVAPEKSLCPVDHPNTGKKGRASPAGHRPGAWLVVPHRHRENLHHVQRRDRFSGGEPDPVADALTVTSGHFIEPVGDHCGRLSDVTDDRSGVRHRAFWNRLQCQPDGIGQVFGASYSQAREALDVQAFDERRERVIDGLGAAVRCEIPDQTDCCEKSGNRFGVVEID